MMNIKDLKISPFTLGLSVPVDIEHLFDQGQTCQKQGELDKARSFYESVLKLNPHHFKTLHCFAILQAQLGNLKEALNFFDLAIAIDSSVASVYSNRGNVLRLGKRLDEAVESYQEAIRINPNFAHAYSSLGVALQELKQYEAAAESFQKAIALKPDFVEAYSNQAVTLLALKKIDLALESCNAAIRLQPDFAQAYFNRGNVLLESQRLKDALVSYNKAIDLKSDYADAYFNLAVANAELDKAEDELDGYNKTLAIDPDFARANFNKSVALLRRGEFELGWQLYEWRWKIEQRDLKHPYIEQPLWLGEESIQGKTVLLHGEQGLGDMIQFCRYAKMVKALGAHVLMEVPSKLVPLLQDLDGVDEVVLQGQQEQQNFDFYCPMMSLPLAFKTTLDSIPSPDPYLQTVSEKVASWHSKMGRKTKPRIGLAWSGNPEHKNDRDRSIPLALLKHYLPDGFEYVCLQNEVRLQDQPALKDTAIRYWGDEIKDFADTAALCELMDLVITVDTSVAHLCGALGKPTWVLLPFRADWRWFNDRKDSPWYRCIELFRQSVDRSWISVMEAVQDALTERSNWGESVEPRKKVLPSLGVSSSQNLGLIEEVDRLVQRGSILRNDGQIEEARIACKAALKIHPQHLDALHLLGNLECDLNNPLLGLEFIDQAIALSLPNAMLYLSRAEAQRLLLDFEAAIGSCDEAIRLEPNNFQAVVRRGVFLIDLQKIDEALECSEKAAALITNSSSDFHDIGVLQYQLKLFDKALMSYNKAIELNPESVVSNWNKAIGLLQLGEFEEGWKLHEWRWRYEKLGIKQQNFHQPYWLGTESIKSKTILLYPEQGLGDELQFCRYTKLVKARGARVLLLVRPVLMPLLLSLDGVDEWLIEEEGMTLPHFDFHCSLMSLPLVFNTNLYNIPSPYFYLQSDSDKVRQWRIKLGRRSKPRVGLAWSGNPVHKNDRNRSLRLDLLLSKLPDGFDYVCIQKGIREEDKTALHTSSIHYFGDDLNDFSDTAALCELMDLVITVDTSLAHLSGALGKPTWVMLPYLPDWRWLLDRDDSPWYKKIRLFRQRFYGDWGSVLDKVSKELLDKDSMTRLVNSAKSRRYKLTTQRQRKKKLFNRFTSHYLQGHSFHQQGKLHQAETSYEAALKIDPRNFDLLHMFGVLQGQLGNLNQAVDFLLQAIAIYPHLALAHANLASSFQQLGRLEEAAASYDKAIEIDPNDAQTYHDRAVVLLELNHFDLALKSCDSAIRLNPSCQEAQLLRGNVLLRGQQYDDALISYNKAIDLQPRNGDAYFNLGLAYLALKKIDRALDCFNKAIELKPDFVHAHLNKSLALLLWGQFKEGWPLYEWRWKNDALGLKPQNFQQPLWLGSGSLRGQTILLHREQGLGDTIQFCRYAKLVKARGARVILEVPVELEPLMHSLEGVDALVSKRQALPHFDFHCPLLSLPLAFKTEIATIPSQGPYLKSDSAKVAEWSAKLGPKTKPRIGLAWHGSAMHKNDSNRSLDLEVLNRYLADGFEYVCLHNELRQVDEPALQVSAIRYWGEDIKDFADTAALCELMDLVISVDTSVAHLSAALGQTTWILLPYVPDWRWLLDREDSPWYDSVKLFRQDADRSWPSVLTRMATDLRRLF
jgi:tetratricopeptide (TPR) repeat protein